MKTKMKWHKDNPARKGIRIPYGIAAFGAGAMLWVTVTAYLIHGGQTGLSSAAFLNRIGTALLLLSACLISVSDSGKRKVVRSIITAGSCLVILLLGNRLLKCDTLRGGEIALLTACAASLLACILSSRKRNPYFR